MRNDTLLWIHQYFGAKPVFEATQDCGAAHSYRATVDYTDMLL